MLVFWAVEEKLTRHQFWLDVAGTWTNVKWKGIFTWEKVECLWVARLCASQVTGVGEVSLLSITLGHFRWAPQTQWFRKVKFPIHQIHKLLLR